MVCNPSDRSSRHFGPGVREPWTTLVASFVAVLGVTIIMGGTITEGQLLGDILGFGMTLCMAIITSQDRLDAIPAGLSQPTHSGLGRQHYVARRHEYPENGVPKGYRCKSHWFLPRETTN